MSLRQAWGILYGEGDGSPEEKSAFRFFFQERTWQTVSCSAEFLLSLQLLIFITSLIIFYMSCGVGGVTIQDLIKMFLAVARGSENGEVDG